MHLKRLEVILALAALTALPCMAQPGFRLEGEDLVLQLEAVAPDSFGVLCERSSVRISLPAGTPKTDLTLPADARKLAIEALWQDGENGGRTLLIELGAGALKEIRSEAGGLRVVLTPSLYPREAYLIGAGDVLQIEVFGDQNLSGRVTVDPTGKIRLQLIGSVRVEGMTSDEVASRIRTELAESYLQNPQVTVEVAEYRSHFVTVLGPVTRPGAHPVLGPTPLSKVLLLAGGFGDKAGYRLTVHRQLSDGGSRVFTVDRKALEEGREDPLLLPDDAVTVAEADFFFIDGEVGRPSLYALPPGLTLMKAVALAGGTTPWADESKVQIHRKVGGQTILETYNLKKIRAHRAPDPELRADDLVAIPRRFL